MADDNSESTLATTPVAEPASTPSPGITPTCVGNTA